MTEFDAADRRIWIAIDLALTSESRRLTRTDPVEQGGRLFHAVTRHLRKMTKEHGYEGVAIRDMNYYGIDPNGPVIIAEDPPDTDQA